jgi:muramoyltetrapeptide carboxypeptidase
MAMITKPRKLEKGSRIAFVAPAGPPDPERLKKGKRFFEKAGYKIKVYSQARRKLGYLAGDDRSRAEALVNAFADDTIDAVMCVRGGYGALRLLPFIDFDTIRKNPKIFIGYSDITVLLLSIYKKCNLITFHGPMAAIEFGKTVKPYTGDIFHDMLAGKLNRDSIKIPSNYKISVISGGIARGRIVGGNLCLMTKLIGTGLLPSFKNRLVFFEDTEEEPYRTDGYLSQRAGRGLYHRRVHSHRAEIRLYVRLESNRCYYRLFFRRQSACHLRFSLRSRKRKDYNTYRRPG